MMSVVHTFRGSRAREVLTANRTYYVRTDGSDSNTGLANNSGGAFLTIQKAIDVIAALDISIYNVDISVAAGTYAGQVVISSPWVGSGTVSITGAGSSSVNIQTSSTMDGMILAKNGGSITVNGVKLSTTGGVGVCLRAEKNGAIDIGTDVNFGAATNYHGYAISGGVINRIGGAYTISGSTYHHMNAESDGCILINACTITLTGTPNFGFFLNAARSGLIEYHSNTFSGSATGARYAASSGGVIFTNGASVTYLPGNAVGTVSPSGGYT